MRTREGFEIDVSELKPENAAEVINLCNKIDALFSMNELQWTPVHKRFYQCLSSALHLIKHQEKGTKNIAFDTFYLDKHFTYRDIHEFYEYKNALHNILQQEVSRKTVPLQRNTVIIKGKKKHPFIVRKARRNTLDRYFIRYDLMNRHGVIIEVDNFSNWWRDTDHADQLCK